MTPEQVRMARGALRIGVRELAALANVSFTTIRAALEGQGIQFLRTGEVANGSGIAVKNRGE